MDETHRDQLKETNELNWARFNDRLEAGLSNLKAELIKWMFLFWLGNAGLMLGLRFFGPR
jgi:hypothetical protein